LPYNNTYEVDRAFINISINDLQSGLPITDLATVTIAGIGQFNTTTGNIIIRNSSIAPDSYTMTTFVSGYDLNLFNFEYTALQERVITINMANETGENIVDWIATVLDPFYNTIIGADTRLLEYDAVNDSFTEIDSCVTNANGRCVYSVELGVKTYIITATKTIDGKTFNAQSSESGEVIFFDQDTVNLFLNIQPDYYVDPELDLAIWYYNDTLVNSTGGDYLANISYLTAYYRDDNSITHTVCVDYYYLDGLVKTHVEGSCDTGISGIVNVNGGRVFDTSFTYIAEISVVQEGGNKKVEYSFDYQRVGGLEDQAGVLAPYIIIALILFTLGLSLYMKNILIFAIGIIPEMIFMIALLPSYWDWKITSLLIFLCSILIFLTRKQESNQSV